MSLKVKAETSFDGHVELLSKPPKIIWDNGNANRFLILVQAPAFKEIMSEISASDNLTTQISIDATAKLFSDMLVNTAKQAGMSMKLSTKPKKANVFTNFSKVKPPAWHDMSCHEAFSQIKATSKLLKSSPQNPWLKGKLVTETL